MDELQRAKANASSARSEARKAWREAKRLASELGQCQDQLSQANKANEEMISAAKVQERHLHKMSALLARVDGNIDCHSCTNYQRSKCKSVVVCVNGNAYMAKPLVQLWRK